MISIDTFRQLALAFEEVVELPHFDKTSFRVNKKIFATLDLARKRAMVKLNEVDQSIFCSIDKSVIYPVNGTWGRQGCTFIELAKAQKSVVIDALTNAYCNVAPKRLSAKYS